MYFVVTALWIHCHVYTLFYVFTFLCILFCVLIILHSSHTSVFAFYIDLCTVLLCAAPWSCRNPNPNPRLGFMQFKCPEL